MEMLNRWSSACLPFIKNNRLYQWPGLNMYAENYGERKTSFNAVIHVAVLDPYQVVMDRACMPRNSHTVHRMSLV